MKRRSIFAAVAMLVVSAIVLSSATYAWFEASSNATVTGISATVTNTTTSIEVTVDDTNWGPSANLGSSTLTGTAIATNLIPVDYVVPASGATVADPVFVSCSMNSEDVIKYESNSVSAGTAGGFSKYVMKIRNNSDQAATVTASPTGASGSTVDFGYTFDYAYVLVDIRAATRAQYLYGKGGYTSLTSDATLINKTATSSNNTVVDSSDTGDLVAALGNTATPQTGTMTFSIAANSTVQIDIYVWAEGQDEQCTGGNGNTGAITGGLSFSAA